MINGIKNIVFIISMIMYSIGVLKAQTDLILLTDPAIQFEVTEEVNQMYNFKFEKADSQFIQLRNRFPQHPLPYFLLGYSQYWRIMPNEENQSYDNRMLAYMDTVIDMAQSMYNKNEENFEAVFFLCAAHAFKGRILSDREKWAGATLAGRSALKYLKISRKFKDFTPEFYFGEGLFNYYAEWIPQNYSAFKPVMWFFPKGTKSEGIKYLTEASNKAFYTRVEAQHYLVRILTFDEKKEAEALPLIKYLKDTYPDNPVFLRLYARVLFSLGRYNECEMIASTILNKIDTHSAGFEEVSGRYAAFFIGWINMNKDNVKSKSHFIRAVDYSEKVGATKMNYYFYSLSALAKMASQEGDKKSAAAYYEKIKTNAGRKHELYKEAKKYIREND